MYIIYKQAIYNKLTKKLIFFFERQKLAVSRKFGNLFYYSNSVIINEKDKKHFFLPTIDEFCQKKKKNRFDFSHFL